MTNYSLNLPIQLQQKAEKFATDQGVSLNEFILWAVAEKVGELSQQFDIAKFPEITYRRGASGELVPVLRGIGLRVQLLAPANQKWGLSTTEIAGEYGITEKQVNQALAFYAVNKQEIDEAIASEQTLEAANV
ncbi:MAG: hypothetical protein U7127_12360 [Phormidium sp.]